MVVQHAVGVQCFPCRELLRASERLGISSLIPECVLTSHRKCIRALPFHAAHESALASIIEESSESPDMM